MRQSDLIKAAVGLLLVAIFAVGYYLNDVREAVPGGNQNRLANSYLEDGKLDRALATFDEAIAQNPDYAESHRGKAITLMLLDRFDEARALFDRAIELDPASALAYANRGTLNDRAGRYAEAIRDYRKAAALNPKLATGPGWLWRFLRNVHEKPPTIVDRANYLEEQLAKPPAERLLRVPELDAQQRMYKK
jgi:tetratricopeptide (TPR) repeat protein